MSDLANLMRSLDTAVAETMSERQEFRGAEATRVVKRRRVVRTTAVVALAVLATASIGGGATALWWDISNPPVSLPVVTITATPSQSPSPSPTASPSPSPSIDPTVNAACPSRADYLSAEEAKRIADSPTTGEVWLDEPLPIVDPFGRSDYDSFWFKVGYRGEYEIIATDLEGMDTINLAERGPDGSFTWITRPYPNLTEAKDPVQPVGVEQALATNSDQCYESLAIPSSVSVDGNLQGPTGVLYRSTQLLEDTQVNAVSTTVMEWGQNKLVRSEIPIADLATKHPFVAEYGGPWDLGAVAVDYWIELAGGWRHQVRFDPFEGSEFASDYLDFECGTMAGPLILAKDLDQASWASSIDFVGEQLLLASPSNPYSLERYDVYVAIRNTLGTEVAPYPAEGELPVVAGLPAQGGGWWLGVNYDYQASLWC